MSFEFSRNIGDAFYRKWKALPSAGSTVYLDSYVDGDVVYLPIDLSANRNNGSLDGVTMALNIEACPDLADDKSVVFTLLGSESESGPFTATVPTYRVTITGAAGAGSPARDVRFPLHPDIERYLVCRITADADCGDVTQSSAEMSLLF